MENNLDIEPQFLGVVKHILKQHLSDDIKVWVFGSRATHKAKKFSDLDLMLDKHDSKITEDTLINLTQAFDESILPWKVEIVDAYDLDQSFLKHINDHKVLFNLD